MNHLHGDSNQEKTVNHAHPHSSLSRATALKSSLVRFPVRPDSDRTRTTDKTGLECDPVSRCRRRHRRSTWAHFCPSSRLCASLLSPRRNPLSISLLLLLQPAWMDACTNPSPLLCLALRFGWNLSQVRWKGKCGESQQPVREINNDSDGRKPFSPFPSQAFFDRFAHCRVQLTLINTPPPGGFCVCVRPTMIMYTHS